MLILCNESDSILIINEVFKKFHQHLLIVYLFAWFIYCHKEGIDLKYNERWTHHTHRYYIRSNFKLLFFLFWVNIYSKAKGLSLGSPMHACNVATCYMSCIIWDTSQEHEFLKFIYLPKFFFFKKNIGFKSFFKTWNLSSLWIHQSFSTHIIALHISLLKVPKISIKHYAYY